MMVEPVRGDRLGLRQVVGEELPVHGLLVGDIVGGERQWPLCPAGIPTGGFSAPRKATRSISS